MNSENGITSLENHSKVSLDSTLTIKTINIHKVALKGSHYLEISNKQLLSYCNSSMTPQF